MSQAKKHNSCRICQSKNVRHIGHVNSDLNQEEFKVYDCLDCGCRFVWREKELFEVMHASSDSPYSFHEIVAEKVRSHFAKKELNSLRRYLSQKTKFKFILNNIPLKDKNMNILELGCSLGYLTAYFICSGYNAIGTDISPTAIKKARSYFGDNFIILTDDFYARYRNYFDYIYYLGTIGCVDDPVSFTLKALSLLKAGGRLLFNVPNVRAAREAGGVWNNFTRPPDLITIFEETFWERFKRFAEVNITYDPYDHRLNGIKHLKKLSYIVREHGRKRAFENKEKCDELKGKVRWRQLLIKQMARCLYYLSRGNLIYRYPAEFGMFVILWKLWKPTR
jgi:SAM-dependent methyltransferase